MASRNSAEFKSRYGPWAVVTGASSGIGAEFSRQLAALGLNLVLVARRQERLARSKLELEAQHNIQVLTVACDLQHTEAVAELAAATAGLDLGLLVNCAGFAVTGEFTQHRIEDEVSLLHVDCRALMMLSHHFGKKFVARRRGGIINVASAASFMPLPYWAHYSAAKAYVLQLSEGLWFEMKKHGVDVLALCPGSTQTEFAQVAGTSMEGMDVKPVVSQAIEGLGRKIRVTPGLGNRVAAIIPRLIPRRLSILLGSQVVRPARS
ncbi:SDR family NAD(P)-dependent oxidoreductase [Piscinibacter terrae]|nr:SDR family NAD(P)-dependent oxidoreductase [Albitalea terrae]